eukprot:1161633-Pelagomonas_calceolata.AAC.1
MQIFQRHTSALITAEAIADIQCRYSQGAHRPSSLLKQLPACRYFYPSINISPGTSALITAETIASLPPVLPISDCEGEAYQECQREMWRLEAERAAEHA